MPDFIECDINGLTMEQLFDALLTKTADGDWALRTMDVTACEEDAIECDIKALPTDAKLKKIIGVNSCGKPAIRLAVQAV